MATGSRSVDALKPRVAVRVGLPGQVGVIEVQNKMVTVKGATAGAIMMEWNVHESSQGSAGLWDTHFRVGGAAGTDLTAKDCPKLSGKTETPYFQSSPQAPAPFKPGAFPNDPEFHNCTKTSKSYAMAWALCIIDSSAVHILSAGLYSFFNRYDQLCLNSGRHDCQDKIFYTEQSYDV
ncbi:hypothetical protein FOPG_16703 [Fusarium oxysporum f. sp. conglutinans race 2 54008]|uniref:Uncharacterized protein n=1 Tax=Fusarium oxysporum f. sp. conglutinans race 2 54008 TaxID=1089457 RepID=X0I1G7_FUSOX|nr:hypothetical protein FOPG_16703 [Fusarium oxysporum f. sp. conglutinans race 2 54008]